jgi:hypothetical protein
LPDEVLRIMRRACANIDLAGEERPAAKTNNCLIIGYRTADPLGYNQTTILDWRSCA